MWSGICFGSFSIVVVVAFFLLCFCFSAAFNYQFVVGNEFFTLCIMNDVYISSWFSPIYFNVPTSFLIIHWCFNRLSYLETLYFERCNLTVFIHLITFHFLTMHMYSGVFAVIRSNGSENKIKWKNQNRIIDSVGSKQSNGILSVSLWYWYEYWLENTLTQKKKKKNNVKPKQMSFKEQEEKRREEKKIPVGNCTSLIRVIFIFAIAVLCFDKMNIWDFCVIEVSLSLSQTQK